MCIPPPTTAKGRTTTASSPCTPPSSVSRSPFAFFFLDLQKSVISFVSCTASSSPDVDLPDVNDDLFVNMIDEDEANGNEDKIMNDTNEQGNLNNKIIRETANPEEHAPNLSSSVSSVSSSSTDVEVSTVVVSTFDECGNLKSREEQLSNNFEIKNHDHNGVMVISFDECGDSISTDDGEEGTNSFEIENDDHHGVIVMSFDECGNLKSTEVDTNSLEMENSDLIVVDETPNRIVTTATRKQTCRIIERLRQRNQEASSGEQAAQMNNDNKSDTSSGMCSSEQRSLILSMSDLTGISYKPKQKKKHKKKMKSRLLQIYARKSKTFTKRSTISGSDSDSTQGTGSVSLQDDKNSDTNSITKTHPTSILRKSVGDETSALSNSANQLSVSFAHGTVFEHPGQTTRKRVRRIPSRARAARIRKQQRVKAALAQMQLDHGVQPSMEATMTILSIEDQMTCNGFHEIEPFVNAASSMDCYVFR